MTAPHIVVGLLAAVSVILVLGSAVQTVVLPAAEPVRLARVAFLAVRLLLRQLASIDDRRRHRLLGWQGPLGVFAQLGTWVTLIVLDFAALLWAADDGRLTWFSIRDALRASGSSITTLGLVRPTRTLGEFVAFVEAGIGLVLLALAITYLPTIYSAFLRRESLVGELAARTKPPPTAPALLADSWEIGRFDDLDELWKRWETWFIELGETHVSFPQLAFFRPGRPSTSWVTAAGAVLDAAALMDAGAGSDPTPKAIWCLRAGIEAIRALADFYGIPPAEGAEIDLPRAEFDAGLAGMERAGVALRVEREALWESFVRWRVRYERPLLSLATLADAAPTAWLPADAFIEHRPPLALRRTRQG